MEIGEPYPYPTDTGAWAAGVHYATASKLMHAVDPAQPYVVIERHSPGPASWHRLPVPTTTDAASLRTRTVRMVRFDLLLTTAEALELGPELDDADQGWLYLWQCARRPPEYLSLLDKSGRALVNAMRGVETSLLIDLPHKGETAVLSSPDRAPLEAALARLETRMR